MKIIEKRTETRITSLKDEGDRDSFTFNEVRALWRRLKKAAEVFNCLVIFFDYLTRVVIFLRLLNTLKKMRDLFRDRF